LLHLTDTPLVRVDNRLVHGQILEAWVPYLKASCIVIVDDDVASDFFRETVIRMAVPRDVRVVISNLADFAENHRRYCSRESKTIVLFSRMADALSAYRSGYAFKTLNIGNIYSDSCKVCCTPSVQLSDQDLQDIGELRKMGVRMELRRVPREKGIDFEDFIKGELRSYFLDGFGTTSCS
jgi:PTS system mannose-specific IIB component